MAIETPKDVDLESLAESPLRAQALSRWAQMRKGQELTRDTVFPGSDIKITIRVVSFSEVQASVAAAWKRWVDDLGMPPPGKDLTFAGDFQDEMTLQLLWRSMRDPENHSRPACPTADELRDATTPAQRSAAYIEYRDLEDEIDPDPERMPVELVEEIKEIIKKKQGAALRSYGSTTLAAFLLFGGDPHASSQHGSSGSTASEEK